MLFDETRLTAFLSTSLELSLSRVTWDGTDRFITIIYKNDDIWTQLFKASFMLPKLLSSESHRLWAGSCRRTLPRLEM